MGILAALGAAGNLATASGGEGGGGGGFGASSRSGDISSPLDINFGKTFAPAAPSSSSTATTVVLGLVILGLVVALVKG